ncbi:hypothetical protein MIDIC_110051 [Alphaproteobacteria bacterium]
MGFVWFLCKFRANFDVLSIATDIYILSSAVLTLAIST